MIIETVLSEELNENQRKAALDDTNEIITLACAGSGKSKTLAYRIAVLINNGAAPESIVAFTFTKKAAESIKRNVAKALGRVGLDVNILGAMYIGTIHSYCQLILSYIEPKYRQFDVLDDNKFILYLISRYHELNIKNFKDNRGLRYFHAIDKIAEAWKTLHDEFLLINDLEKHNAELYSMLSGLKSMLNDDEFIDFSSMIYLVAEYLENNNLNENIPIANLKHILVDEYQDVNLAQEKLISHLYAQAGNLFVVGDDDQAIYGWRGANVENILDFEQRYPNCKSHTLNVNYRSTSPIIESSNNFIAEELGAKRITKNPVAGKNIEPRHLGNFWFDTRSEEAEWVADQIDNLMETEYTENDGKVRGLTAGDFAILMRSTRSPEQDEQPRHAAFTNKLKEREIRYQLEAGGSIFDVPEVAVIKECFELFRHENPNREEVTKLYKETILPVFDKANFNILTNIFSAWGRKIHNPPGSARQRLYPQQLVYEILEAFDVSHSNIDHATFSAMGTFSKIIQDVESVFMSVDSSYRYASILNFINNIAKKGYNLTSEDIYKDPNAVIVSTVHKAKGLEYPAVFVVDCENGGRFPSRSQGYTGLLPEEYMGDALQLDRYQTTKPSEARLFYTALTRAERYLYITGARELPQASSLKKPSVFANRINHEELVTNIDDLPEINTQETPVPRLSEDVIPTSFSDIKYYLKCPKDYLYRKVYGFSPPINEMMGFGQTVHTAIATLHSTFNDVPPTLDEAQQIAIDIFHLKHVPQSRDPENTPGPYEAAQNRSGEIAKEYVEKYAEDFCGSRQVEARFEIPADNAVISGSIDLLIRENENGEILDACVIDFKAMSGESLLGKEAPLDWTELSLQVQLYASAAREILNENAKTGYVHLLKDNQRVEVPIDESSVDKALKNVYWSVERILKLDFPMRPDANKCESCDFKSLCPKEYEDFKTDEFPPPISIPISIIEDSSIMAKAFSQVESN